MDNINEIKSRLRIEDVVSEYVTLKKAGRNFKGLCPFHQENTPSFIVSPEKGLAYCFGCHRGGDVFQFVQEVESLDFSQVIKILAKKAGVELDEYHFSNESVKDKSDKNILFELQEKAVKYFQDNLFKKEPDCVRALEYLKKRGLVDQTISDFKIGFASSNLPSFYSSVKDLGYSTDLLVKSGLILKNERGEFFDRFRERIIFPINNAQGLPVAFTGRILDTGEPKYLNSPETAIFYKSGVLFGLDFAKKQIKEKDFVIVVEGQMDVIMSHQANIKNVVATSGTALTTQHLEMLYRLTKNIVFCFDSDSAGEKATLRAIPLALDKGFYIEMINLKKKDPADLIQEDPEAFEKEILAKKYFLFSLFERLEEKNVLQDLKSKQESLKELLELVSGVHSRIEISEILKQLGLFFNISESDLRIEFEKIRLNKDKFQNTEDVIVIKDKKFNNLDFLRAFILAFPETATGAKAKLNHLNEIFNIFEPEFLENHIYNSRKDNYTEDLKDILSKETKNTYSQGKIDSLIGFQMLISEYYEEMAKEDLEKEFMYILKNIWLSYKKRRIEEISLEFTKAEKEGNRAKIDQLEQEVLSLTNYNLNG